MLIAKSLLLLPDNDTKRVSAEDQAKFKVHLLKCTEKTWLDFDLCMFELSLFYKLFPPDTLFEEYKWVFWTENALNDRLSKLLLSGAMGDFAQRHQPDFQLCIRQTSTSTPFPIKQCAAKRVVIAIDYGSTHSGFAYAKTTPPQSIVLATGLTAKQPTCVLLDANLNLVAFGNEAKEWFMRNLAGDILLGKFSAQSTGPGAISGEYLFFENLKISLLDRNNTKTEYCYAMNNPKRKVALELVVSKILEYLKLEALKRCGDGVEDPSQVLWVLTVPAIWTARDKLFMRKCAHQAGMISDIQSPDLVLALEPECAALAACSNTPEQQQQQRISLKRGSKILTFDCGGGTVDVCLLQVVSEEHEKFACKHLLPPSGGGWGSVQIDKAFIALMDRFMGPGFYKRVSIVNPAVLIELMEQWERLKCGLTLTDFLEAEAKQCKTRKTLDLTGVMKESTQSFSTLCKQFNASCAEEQQFHVRAKQDNILTTNALRLSLPMKLIASLFLPTLDTIVDHCGKLFRNNAEEMQGLTQVLLVGGLGSNPYLHYKFERTFPQLTVVKSTTQHSSALVEMGAVKFGLQPMVFHSRRSNITLGVKTTVECHERMPRTELFMQNRFYDASTKRYFCRNMFKPFLLAGEEVSQDRRVVQTFRAPSKESEFCKFDIYTCDGDTCVVDFVTEPGCRLMAQLLVPVVRGEMAELELALKLGLNEILAEVTNKSTGELVLSRVLFDDSAGSGNVDV